MKKYFLLPFSLLFIFSVLSGCNQSSLEPEKVTNKDKLKIYTTIFPLQDFSEKIGGKYVQVENIVPVGSEAHSFEPTSNTMIQIAEGDAFIYLGTGIEGFADAVINAVKNEDTKIVKASEGITLIKSQEPVEEEGNEHEGEETAEHEEGDVDPHVWLDPERAIQLAENIKNAFVQINPEQKEYFEDNYQTLKADLEKLDLSFQKMVLDASKKTLIGAHSAYGYWQDAYGLKPIGISGLSPNDEPSQKKLQEIIEAAGQQEIDYVLFEQNVENRIAEVIKREIGAKTLTLHNLEALSEEDINNNEDYFSLMEKNIETLRKVLK